MILSNSLLRELDLTFLDHNDEWSPGMDPRKEYIRVPGYRCACHSIYREGTEVDLVGGAVGNKKAKFLTCTNCGHSFASIQ